MGQTLMAQCRCGFNQNVDFGSGRFDCSYTSSVPCYCQACKSMCSLNVRLKKLSCPNCESESILPYNNSQMFKGEILADDNEPSSQKNPSALILTPEEVQERIKISEMSFQEKEFFFGSNEYGKPLTKEPQSKILVCDDLNKNILDYLCPKCDKFTLFFTTQDYYD